MIYTAVMVIFTDFLVGVFSAMFIYGVLYKFLDKPAESSPATADLDVPLADVRQITDEFP